MHDEKIYRVARLMCGIIGAFGEFNENEFIDHLVEVEDGMYRRGPDQRNLVKKDGFIGAHSRLIVQGDANDGIQPFEFRNLIVLFNGNLYNKDSLKEELTDFGYKFQGVSDTEVVAVSIHKWGLDAFVKFNGFFAIAFFDKEKNTLTLSRDKYGQKPIYYSQASESVFFGSTEETIPKKHIGKIRDESYMDFITYGFIPAPNTMFENLEILEPSSYISFTYSNNSVNKVTKSSYWSPQISNKITNANDAYRDLISVLKDSVREGTQADTKVSCLYSGGVDSSLLFSYVRDISPEVFAITADFGEGDDAAIRSKPLVDAYKHDNHIVKFVSKEEVNSSLTNTDRICKTPFDDTSIIPSNVVFSTVKKEGYSVAITGDGADELFCGYQSFLYLKRLEPFLSKKYDVIRKILKFLFGRLLSKYKGRDLTRIFMNEEEILIDLSCNGFKLSEQAASRYEINSEYDPTHYVKKILDKYNDLDIVSKFRILNLTFKLPNQMLYKIDRASMFNSVEARPIFLNDRNVNCALSIESNLMLENGTKGILREICERKLPTKEWKLSKTGFGWKTNNYREIFAVEDDMLLNKKVNIPGSRLINNRVCNHKRGYYGLFSLASWVKANL